MLISFVDENVSRTVKGFPLIIEPSVVIVEETLPDIKLLEGLVSKFDYDALRTGYDQVYPYIDDNVKQNKNIHLPVPTDLPIRIPSSLDFSKYSNSQEKAHVETTNDDENNDEFTKTNPNDAMISNVSGDDTNGEDCSNDNDSTLITHLHRILMDVHVLEGSLVCPETGRKYPIHDGIPNMLLHEDEV
jgi:uncharacterized protein YbaR (Trm112 family)